MEQKSDSNGFVLGGIAVIFILIIAIIALAKMGQNKKTNNLPTNQLLLNSKVTSSTGSVKYEDKKCSISFNYPKEWQKSDIKLPLPGEPISQITFNETGKNSIFSFICFDAKKYTFEQFIAKDTVNSGQIGSMVVGDVTFQRSGNFVYATKNNKLFIFQMFFTKYDLTPQSGYEEIYMNIIKSVKF